MGRLEGRRAVVTGGSKGIGLAVVAALVDEGASVVAAARNRTDEVGRLEDGGAVRFVAADLSTAAGMAEVTDAALADGPVDVLVNNVGSGKPTVDRNGFLTVPDQDWLDIFEMNVLSAVRACRAVLPGMVTGGRGSIVNVSSANGRAPFIRSPDYAASKAALNLLTKVLSEEFARQGIRVNTVSPGAIRTPFWDAEGGAGDFMARQLDTTKTDLYASILPQFLRLAMPRMGTAAEVAAAIVFLVSDDASYITGIDLGVDGGFHKTT